MNEYTYIKFKCKLRKEMINISSFAFSTSLLGSAVFGIYLFFAQQIVSASKIVNSAVSHACNGTELIDSRELVKQMIRCEPIRKMFKSDGKLDINSLRSVSTETKQNVEDVFSDFLKEGS